MKLLLSGYHGRMGKEVLALSEKHYRNSSVVCGVDHNATGEEPVPCFKEYRYAMSEVDCIIDFSYHENTSELLNFAMANGIPLVIATTGQTEEERKMIEDASTDIPIFFSANDSIGVALLLESAKAIVRAMPDADIEIVEVHHNKKLDAPSGTALAFASALRQIRPNAIPCIGRAGYVKRDKNEIGIHSIRMGNAVGTHEIIIGTDTQTITLRHEAHDRKMYAEGALSAAEFLIGKPAGLYGMPDLMNAKSQGDEFK